MNHTTIGDIVRGDREVFPPYLYEADRATRRRAPMRPRIALRVTLPAFAAHVPARPLHALDPIFNGVPTEQARKRLIASYDHSLTEPEWALGYRWDIVVTGPSATPFESRQEGQP